MTASQLTFNQQPVFNLTMEHVSKDFQGKTALRDINLRVRQGEFIYLIGASGAGKTTLLDLIRHDEVPDQGRILVDHFNVKHLKKKEIPYLRREIGSIFQTTELIPHLSVKDNLVYPLEALGKSDQLIKQRYQDVLHLVELYDFRNQSVDQLSGGQAQRVMLARALMNVPSLLLADEPTGQLDPPSAEKIIKLLEIIAAGPTAVIMVTHDRNIVDTHSKRVVTLDSVTHTIKSDVEKGGYNVDES